MINPDNRETPLWQCPKCETLNDKDKCFICYTPRVTSRPVAAPSFGGGVPETGTGANIGLIIGLAVGITVLILVILLALMM